MTSPSRAVPSSAVDAIASEARAFWRSYLWHHRHPLTRRLHRIGSGVCIAGLVATASGAGAVWLPVAIATGYLFSFSGHWFVERNRPLTFRSPVRAAIANWVLFFYEMRWDVEVALAQIALDPPSTDQIDTQ